MSGPTSISSATVESPAGSRRGQAYTNPSRTQSTRSRPSAIVAPSPARANSSTHSRPPSASRVEDILPQRDYETTNVAQTARKRSTDRPPPSRAESSRSASVHHHRTSSRSDQQSQYQPSIMSGTTAVASNAGPAPIVTPVESRHVGAGGKAGRRTTIPAQTGNWLLGKTIGAGSMGKVKLARRVEGGEEVRMKKSTFPMSETNFNIAGRCEDRPPRIYKRRKSTSKSSRS